jgi:hypothetical protein
MGREGVDSQFAQAVVLLNHAPDLLDAATSASGEARPAQATDTLHEQVLPEVTCRIRAETNLKAAQHSRNALEARLREWMWLHHGHGSLYGDDGEMQCHTCHLDFKRQDLEEITLRLGALASPPAAS